MGDITLRELYSRLGNFEEIRVYKDCDGDCNIEISKDKKCISIYFDINDLEKSDYDVIEDAIQRSLDKLRK